MPRRTEPKRPPHLVPDLVRGWFLEVIRKECPEVLTDLRERVFDPLAASWPEPELRTFLRQRRPGAPEILRHSDYRRIRAAITRWARRWHVNTAWMRDESWRTLAFWAANPLLRLQWAPFTDVRRQEGLATRPAVLRPRDDSTMRWLVRHRVCTPSTSVRELASSAGQHVDADSIRVEINRLAKSLELPVRRRGRPPTRR